MGFWTSTGINGMWGQPTETQPTYRPHLNQSENQFEEGEPVWGRDPELRESCGDAREDIRKYLGAKHSPKILSRLARSWVPPSNRATLLKRVLKLIKMSPAYDFKNEARSHRFIYSCTSLLKEEIKWWIWLQKASKGCIWLHKKVFPKALQGLIRDYKPFV